MGLPLKQIVPNGSQVELMSATQSLKLLGVAGSGKTTALMLMALFQQERQFLYTAFNKRSVEQAEGIIQQAGLRNIKAITFHTLARGELFDGQKLKFFKDFGVANIIQELDLREMPGIPNSNYIMATHVLNMFRFFCNSTLLTMDDVKASHFPFMENIGFFLSYFEQIRDHAGELYHRMVSGALPMVPDLFLKLFFFKKTHDYHNAYDVLLFDEFQDASPVMAEAFMRFPHQKVCAGDAHQQIYQWRFAEDSLDSIELPQIEMNRTFRFGKAIAAATSNVVRWKRHLGFSVSDFEIEPNHTMRPVPSLTAIISRSNVGLFYRAIRMLNSDNPLMDEVYFEGGFESYGRTNSGYSVYDVYNLKNKRHQHIRNDMIKNMSDLAELEAFATSSGDMQLHVLISLVTEYGRHTLSHMQQLSAASVRETERSQAKVIFTTAHRCKGLEYKEVFVEDDFLDESTVLTRLAHENRGRRDLVEEINLAYVAISRCVATANVPERLLKG